MYLYLLFGESNHGQGGNMHVKKYLFTNYHYQLVTKTSLQYHSDIKRLCL